MREFARTRYENVVYVRFDKDKLLRRIFDADFDIERIVHELEIAKHLGVALRTLQLHFEESSISGTILEEIQRVKFAKVCELLAKTKKPIAEIVRLTGFRTHSSLKAAFRKKFGTSMAAYRKAQRDAC